MNNLNANVINANSIDNSPASIQRVFIKRDYHEGVNIRFSLDYPPELSGRIKESTFASTINQINAMFQEAETASCSSCLESLFGFLTANLLHVCKATSYEKCLKRVSKFLAEENSRVYLRKGVAISDPMQHGLRTMVITIYNDPR